MEEPTPDHLLKDWALMTSQLKNIGETSVPRNSFGTTEDKPERIQLIGFCDNSEKAYAAVVYAMLTDLGLSGISVNLVMAKSRVAPLSRLSFPRLELLSCLILARLITAVKDMLDPLIEVEISQCFTDSRSALCWIQGTSKE